uniref:ecto-ADP-ribosyltransferase 4 n=1 Tax=Scatophagus argus TaxID=75038 RepID=UPI001ED7D2EE|nr:ecto-ADP-ribosyltransferase 4 [Scatophagus argus]
MWNKRKLLLAAGIFIALCYKATGNREKPLDMAPNAVDSRYDGCREQALEKFIHSGLLEQELNDNVLFQNTWKEEKCSDVIPGKTINHTKAQLAYTSVGTNFLKTFNNAVETMGVNVSTYENNFHFKSLHFLLMDSMTAMPSEKCKTVYALPEEHYTAIKGSKVRLGRFIIAHSDSKQMEDLDGQVLLRITSCFFANSMMNICKKEDVILLSPAEVFTVEDVQDITDEVADTEYTEIFLKHSAISPSNKCYIFSRSPANACSRWIVLVLVALSLFTFFTC